MKQVYAQHVSRAHALVLQAPWALHTVQDTSITSIQGSQQECHKSGTQQQCVNFPHSISADMHTQVHHAAEVQDTAGR